MHALVMALGHSTNDQRRLIDNQLSLQKGERKQLLNERDDEVRPRSSGIPVEAVRTLNDCRLTIAERRCSRSRACNRPANRRHSESELRVVGSNTTPHSSSKWIGRGTTASACVMGNALPSANLVSHHAIHFDDLTAVVQRLESLSRQLRVVPDMHCLRS
jgi:hypothetical protein